MMLGKRPRHPMKRTTSMTEFSFDLNTTNGEVHQLPSDPQQNPFNQIQGPQRQSGRVYEGIDQRFLAAAVSPRNPIRNSADLVGTAHFLRACSLCKRRLVPGRDIYMYRGDSAFCSQECRQQQMNNDERKEKCSLASKKESASTPTAGSQVSTKGETVAAV